MANGVPEIGEANELLTVPQVAARLGLSEKAIYGRAKKWSFAVKLSHRVLRFYRVGLEQWVADRALGNNRNDQG